MEIKIKSESGIVPAYETAGSAGMDIRAYLKEPVELLPGQRAPCQKRSCYQARDRSCQWHWNHRQ